MLRGGGGGTKAGTRFVAQLRFSLRRSPKELGGTIKNGEGRWRVIGINISTKTEAYNNIVEYHRKVIDKSMSTCDSATSKPHVFKPFSNREFWYNHGMYRADSANDRQFDTDEYLSLLQLRNETRCV